MNTIMSHKGEKIIMRIFVAKENALSFIFTKEIASMKLREQGMIIGINAYQKQSLDEILILSKKFSKKMSFSVMFDTVHIQLLGYFGLIKKSQANSALLGSNSEGAHGISKYFFLDHFSPSFLSQKLLFQEL